MALQSGSKLGPYEILAPAGVGGMGEVYRARDTRLDRTVAIKVLPSDLSSNPELKQRFEREARAISSLQHPNICTLYDIGSQDRTDYLVMEYLDGQTLADRLQKGALPLEQVLKIGSQIADALDKAHRQGIIHRDLKPGNVMLTKSGAKLLDFGLAKAVNKTFAAVAAPLAHSTPTMSMQSLSAPVAPLTQAGSVLGTYQYIAPEVLQGRDADARSDIFALGVVLYEMATGQHAFEGRTTASVIAAILERDPPPISSIQPIAPPALDGLVRMCLAKDPEERWQTAHDVKLQLRLISTPETPPVGKDDRSSRKQLSRWTMLTAAILLAVVFVATYLMRKPLAVGQSIRTEINLQGDQQRGALGSTQFGFAISPDGTRVVYAASSQGVSSLWLRNLNQVTAQSLPGTQDGAFPFWSPDGQKIGFFAQSKLKTLTLTGNDSIALCDAPNGRGGSWGRKGVIIFTPNINQPIFRVPETGGEPVPVTSIDSSKGVYSHRWPYFLPDGEHFLYLSVVPGSQRWLGQGTIFAGSIDKMEPKAITAELTTAEFASGYLLYTRQDNLLVAQRFDTSTLELKGDAVPVAQEVLRIPSLFRTYFSVSQNGLLTYQRGGPTQQETADSIVLFDRKGSKVADVDKGRIFSAPRFSPDGKRVLYNTLEGTNRELWIYDVVRDFKRRLTTGQETGNTGSGTWSPDGKQVAFGSYTPGRYALYVVNSDGSGGETEITPADVIPRGPSDWTSKGNLLAISAGVSLASSHVEFRDMSSPEHKLVTAPAISGTELARDPRFSPDGKYLAYTSMESGTPQVTVSAFPGIGGRWQVSTDGGTRPVWRRDGKELLYLGSSGNWVIAVEVRRTNDGLEFGKPNKLFQMSTAVGTNQFDVTPDGQRLIVVGTTRTDVPPIELVTNWTAELKPQ